MTPVEIANAALAKLGDVPIQALPPREAFGEVTGTPEERLQAVIRRSVLYSETAQMAGATYYVHRDAMLSSYPWAFALRRSELQRRSSDEAHRYRYFFWLPAGESVLGIGIRAVYTEADAVRPLVDEWAREAGGISSYWGTLWGEWIEDVDETEWPPSVINALVLRLCSEWAYYVTDQANLTEIYERKAMAALDDAKRIDSQSRPTALSRSFSSIDARYRGGTSTRAYRTG